MANIPQLNNGATDLCINRTTTGQVDVMTRNMKPCVIHYKFAPKTAASVATINGLTGDNSTTPENNPHNVTLSYSAGKYEYGPIINDDLYVSAEILTLTNDGSSVSISVSEWKSDTLQN
jgi:hypothetical protein